jgi:AraC family transcriptional regulator, arabinose operon regulatory protein
MSARLITPAPQLEELITGDFHRTADYFAYRPGGTDDWLLIYTCAGKGRFGYPAGELFAEVGDMVLLRPGTPHDYGVEPSLQSWHLLWTHMRPRPHWIDYLRWPIAAPGIFKLHLPAGAARDKIAGRFADVHQLATGAHRRKNALAMNALEEMLLWCDDVNPESEQAAIDSRVRAAMDFFAGAVNRKVSLEEAADAAGISCSRLSHLFRSQLGQTPLEFLETQRMTRALQLLRITGLSVKEIAAAVGFDNPFYFTLRFKRKMGVSPRTWRLGLSK